MNDGVVAIRKNKGGQGVQIASGQEVIRLISFVNTQRITVSSVDRYAFFKHVPKLN